MRVHEATDAEIAAVSRRRSPGRTPPTPSAAQTYFVAMLGSRIVGQTVLSRCPADHPYFPGHWSHDTFVFQAYRGMGIGETLLRHTADRARLENAAELWGIVHPDNAASLALCDKLGWTQAGIEEWRTLPDGRKRLLLRLSLADES